MTGKSFLMCHAGIGAKFCMPDEEKAGELVGFFAGDAPLLNVPLIKGIHELTKTAGRVGTTHLLDFN